LVEALEQALLAAARKKYGLKQELEAKYNQDAARLNFSNSITVVKEVKSPPTEIVLEEARELDGDAQIRDSLGKPR